MKAKHVNLLISLATVMLFSFSCFCISRMAQTSNQLINCRNHILEFKDIILRLKNKTERNHQELTKALNEMKYDFRERENVSLNLVSFALGIPTIQRGNHTYLKQTLTSLISRMSSLEERDALMIVSVADSNEDYLKYVVDMISKKFKRQLKSGSLEIISIPPFFYPDTLYAKRSPEDSQLESWRIKQVLDFCFLMLYAQPKAMYYLQLEDDIIAKKMYLKKITEFVHTLTSNNWFYIEFSVLGFIGKLFKTEDLTDVVHFFLTFYKEKPIDLLLEDIFHVKLCHPGETIKNCIKRTEQIRIQYRPSLFQHVGIQSSFPGAEQYLKEL